MKLFTIGASVSQGFMSLAAARTDLCFSTLIAENLGLQPGSEDYRYPDWPEGGLPANIERIMRRLGRKYGADIKGLEWPFAFKTINDVLDESEDFYERGAGRETEPYPGGATFFHNVAVRGFDVADAWKLTPLICRQQIDLANATNGDDNLFGAANASLYRTALRVLNPSGDAANDDCSQLEWLKRHAEREGVENLILWLGSNNALETVLALKIRQTLNDPNRRPVDMSHVERAAADWNLWHPEDFEAEYRALLDRVDATMSGQNAAPQWKVFVATVPAVTMAPLAKGVGDRFHVTRTIDGTARRYTYFKYYTYFPFEEDFAHDTGTHLTGQEAVHIDDVIHAYNRAIRAAVAEKNAAHGSERYHIVDAATHLDDLAWKEKRRVSTVRILLIRLTPMTATCRVPPLSRVKLGIGWSRGVARDAEQ